jgi:hypothetical protein
MQFASLPILFEPEAPTHITNGPIVTFIAETLSRDLSIRNSVLADFTLGAFNHPLRYRNARHHRNTR